ncbi:MAG: transposase [Kordiimonadaceae bacterium]|nr:transposase [Kordiimonadaceae bacterium]
MAGKGQRQEGRWRESFKRRVVAEAAASDLSASEIARRNGVNPNLLFNWRKKYGAEVEQSSVGTEVCLVPVEVEASPVAKSDSSSASEADFLEVTLPCGARVRCGNPTAPALLSTALSALKPHTQSTVP